MRLVCNTLNKSLSSSFVALKLISNGAEISTAAKTIAISKCLFCAVVNCFKLCSLLQCNSYYLLLKSSNKFILAYCNRVVPIKGLVLFSFYDNSVSRHSRSLNTKCVYGVECDGFLVTPYDLDASSVYNRVILSNVLGKYISCAPDEFNIINLSTLTRLVFCKERIDSFGSNVRLQKGKTGIKFLSFVEGSLGRDLICVNASWCVYKDPLCLLNWFVSNNNVANGTVRDYFVYIARVYNVFTHIICSSMSLRGSVLNERLLLPRGYISLANELLIVSCKRLHSVVGVLDFDSLLEVAVEYAPTFVISSNTELNLNAVKRVLSVFLLDSSGLSYTKFKTLKCKIKHFFVNVVNIVNSNANLSDANNVLRLLKLIGVSVVSIGAITFLALPAWRLSLGNSVNVMCFWDIKLSSKCNNNVKLLCKRVPRLSARAYLSVLMLIRRYLNSFGFVEFKTDCVLNKRSISSFKTLKCVPILSVNNDLFVKCSDIPNLAITYYTQNLNTSGVYEFCKLTVNTTSIEVLCVIGDRRLFYHLFYSFYWVFLRAYPLIVKSVNNSWQVLNLNLRCLCTLSKLPCSVLSSSSLDKETFCLESTCQDINIAATSSVFYTLDMVVLIKSVSESHSFVYKLQSYISMLCSARVLHHKRFIRFVLVSLRLKCFSSCASLFHKFCWVLENFIRDNNGKIVWKC